MENENFENNEMEEAGTHLGNWDGETHPDIIDNWTDPEHKKDALEMWEVDHPQPWDGRSEPREQQFETLDEYEDARIQYRVNQKLADRAPGGPPPNPRENDDYAVEKTEIVNHIQKYSKDEQDALAHGDRKAAKHARGMRELFEKDFKKLETEHPTPMFKAAFDKGLSSYKADLDNAVDNLDDFEDRRANAESDAQFYKDCQQRIKVVNQVSDDNTLYFLMGDSKHNGRREDFYVSKVELPKGVKQKLLDESAYKGTLYDLLIKDGYVEPMEPPVVDDENLDSADPNNMTQEQYERWRESHGGRPTYSYRGHPEARVKKG